MRRSRSRSPSRCRRCDCNQPPPPPAPVADKGEKSSDNRISVWLMFLFICLTAGTIGLCMYQPDLLGVFVFLYSTLLFVLLTGNKEGQAALQGFLTANGAFLLAAQVSKSLAAAPKKD